MNSDFRVATDWPEHPKTLHLISLGGEHAAMCLLRLWAYAAQYRPDGRLVGLDDAAIEAKAGWRGEAGNFVAMLLACPPHCDSHTGFAVRERGIVALHDWTEHNAYASFSPERSAAARKAAQARWQKNKPVTANHMRSASKAHDAPSPSPSPAPGSIRRAREHSQPVNVPAVSPTVSDRLPDPDPDRKAKDEPDEYARRWRRRQDLVAEVKRDGFSGAEARAEETRRFQSEFPNEPEPAHPDPGLDDALEALGDGA